MSATNPENENATYTDAYWEKHLSDFKQSKLTKAKYCRENNVPYTQFLYRLRREQQKTLAKVVCVSEQPAQPVAVMQVNSHIQISFYDQDSLASLIQRLC